MGADQLLRLVNIVLWLAALGSFFYSTNCHPKAHRRERFWYSSILGSYIVHTIIFFIVVALRNQPPSVEMTTWSAIVYMHGALSLIIKEVLVVLRARMMDK